MTTPWRKIRQEIKTQFNRYIVAVSGGVDSMFVLDLVARTGVEFRVVHVDHSERVESRADADFVADYCAKQGYDCVIHRLEPSEKMNESTWREHRYRALKQEMVEFGADRIITGHHLNDQVETVLMRLMRGAHCTDLGMQVDNGFVYRPLLDVLRVDIEEHAERCGIPWREDVTNTDTTYERNWVRHVVIPEMMVRRNVLKTISRSVKPPEYEKRDFFD